MNIMKAGTAVAVGLMLSGCHIIYGKAAMEAGPSAEEAVQKLDDFNWLMSVIRDGKNPKARVLAVKKIIMPHILNNIIRDNDQAEVRAAALERLIELGKLDSDLRDGALEKVVTGHEYLEASRIKVIQSHSIHSFHKSDLEKVVMDNSEAVAVRKAAIQKIGDYMEARVLASVLDCAADEKNPNKKVCEEIVKTWLSESADGSANNRKLDVLVNVVWANPEGNCVCKASSQARRLAYSLINTDEKKAEAIKHAVWTAKSHECVENTSLVKELIAATDNEVVLKEFVNTPGCLKEEVLPYIKAAVRKISDEKFLVRNVLGEASLFKDDQEFLLEVVNKVKDPAIQEKLGDSVRAKYSKDMNERRSAFARIFERDVRQAFGIARGWTVEELEAVANQKILVGLLKIHGEMTKNDWPRIQAATCKTIKTALLKHVVAQEKALSQEKRKALINAQIAKAKKLNNEGTTLVVGNCYLGMPLIGLVALNGEQDFKAAPSDIGVNEADDTVVVKSLTWSSKDLYKATGLEKAEVQFKFPAKFGVSTFKLGMTKITYEKNAIAEYFGDYSDSFKGGDVYCESETQAKEVKLMFWTKSGTLEMYELKD